MQGIYVKIYFNTYSITTDFRFTNFTTIFHSNVKRVKHVQEKAAEERRIAEEKAAEERRIAEEKARQKAAQQANWRTAGLCQHCGGELKGFFSKKCTVCGKPKDY